VDEKGKKRRSQKLGWKSSGFSNMGGREQRVVDCKRKVTGGRNGLMKDSGGIFGATGERSGGGEESYRPRRSRLGDAIMVMNGTR